MLRFDLPPVWSNVARAEAFVTFALSGLSLLLGAPWPMLLLVLQGTVRGFFGHYRCPSHRFLAARFEARGWGGKREDAGAKMFANKIAVVASLVALVAYFLGSSFWKVPCAVLVVFSTLEWALSFCAACWAYNLWYRFFPPKSA